MCVFKKIKNNNKETWLSFSIYHCLKKCKDQKISRILIKMGTIVKHIQIAP